MNYFPILFATLIGATLEKYFHHRMLEAVSNLQTRNVVVRPRIDHSTRVSVRVKVAYVSGFTFIDSSRSQS
jgi:hypothetical protein